MLQKFLMGDVSIDIKSEYPSPSFPFSFSVDSNLNHVRVDPESFDPDLDSLSQCYDLDPHYFRCLDLDAN